MERDPFIQRHPEILGGTPVFVGTRVPVRALFDYLVEGDSLDAFLEDFPGVSREMAIGLITRAAEALVGESLRTHNDR